MVVALLRQQFQNLHLGVADPRGEFKSAVPSMFLSFAIQFSPTLPSSRPLFDSFWFFKKLFLNFGKAYFVNVTFGMKQKEKKVNDCKIDAKMIKLANKFVQI